MRESNNAKIDRQIDIQTYMIRWIDQTTESDEFKVSEEEEAGLGLCRSP